MKTFKRGLTKPTISAAGSRPLRRTARPGLLAIAAAIALVAAACTGYANGGAPTYTYPPPAPPASSMPGMDPYPTGSAPAPSTAPTASEPPSTAIPPAGSPSTGGVALHIAAQNIQFDTNHMEASAGQAFVLEFDNNDPGVPHNVEIKDAGGASVFKGQVITGPAKTSYQVPALPAGSYTFQCDVHPTMTGTLTVT